MIEERAVSFIEWARVWYIYKLASHSEKAFRIQSLFPLQRMNVFKRTMEALLYPASGTCLCRSSIICGIHCSVDDPLPCILPQNLIATYLWRGRLVSPPAAPSAPLSSGGWSNKESSVLVSLCMHVPSHTVLWSKYTVLVLYVEKDTEHVHIEYMREAYCINSMTVHIEYTVSGGSTPAVDWERPIVLIGWLIV